MSLKSRAPSIVFAAYFALALLPGLCFPQKSGTSPDQRSLTEIERRIERSDLSGVDQSLMSILIAKPDNIRALELLARLRSSQGRLSESRALYQRVLRLDPKATMAKVRAARASRTFWATRMRPFDCSVALTRRD